MSNTTLPPDFDAWTQTFTLLLSDGTPFEASMGDINWFRNYGIRLAINWATQIGASVILLLVLVVLTRREKRQSAIFIMNALCLILNTIRTFLQCLWLTSEWYNPYALVSGDFSRITAATRANTIASNTLTFLLVACIMISLSLQVWVVCITAKPLHRVIIMGSTTVIALIAIGFRFAVDVISNMMTMEDQGMRDYQTLLTSMNVTQAIAIWYYCCVFTFKLGFALVQRKRLKMAQFGPMQVIFIMGCQTMIIPALFTSLQFYDKVPELGSQSLTLICIFLPLSAIWAGILANDSSVAARGADAHQRLLQEQFYNSHAAASNVNCGSRTPEKSSVASANMSSATSSKDPQSPTNTLATRRGHESMDKTGIFVGRDWSVEGTEASNKV